MAEFHMPDRAITLLDKWAKRSIREGTKSMLVFLDHHKHKFDWGNDNLDNREVLV